MPSQPTPRSRDASEDGALFDFLLENTTDQIYFKDREGRFLRISRAVAEYLKVGGPRDVIGRTDFDFWSEETARAAAEDERRVMETGEPIVGKVERLAYPSGRVAWDYTSKLPLRSASGEIIGICGINKDFTEVKAMQDALREERNRLRTLSEELQRKNAQIEADLQMARKVQEALLPDGCNDGTTIELGRLRLSHRYRPAAAVGGDFFHLFPLGEGRAGVFLCDVMGHGVRAALVTAVIRAVLEELRPMTLDPAALLGAMNRRLRALLERVEEPFLATAIYLIADAPEEELRISIAGHPSPSCLNRQGGAGRILGDERACRGPALGLIDGASYPVFREPFGPSDRIVLFTDGVYEVEDAEGKAFGIDALREALVSEASLPAEALFAAVLSRIRQAIRKPEFEDDVCLLCLEHDVP